MWSFLNTTVGVAIGVSLYKFVEALFFHDDIHEARGAAVVCAIFIVAAGLLLVRAVKEDSK